MAPADKHDTDLSVDLYKSHKSKTKWKFQKVFEILLKRPYKLNIPCLGLEPLLQVSTHTQISALT